jgi:hypothetical protein
MPIPVLCEGSFCIMEEFSLTTEAIPSEPRGLLETLQIPTKTVIFACMFALIFFFKKNKIYYQIKELRNHSGLLCYTFLDSIISVKGYVLCVI